MKGHILEQAGWSDGTPSGRASVESGRHVDTSDRSNNRGIRCSNDSGDFGNRFRCGHRRRRIDHAGGADDSRSIRRSTGEVAVRRIDAEGSAAFFGIGKNLRAPEDAVGRSRSVRQLHEQVRAGDAVRAAAGVRREAHRGRAGEGPRRCHSAAAGPGDRTRPFLSGGSNQHHRRSDGVRDIHEVSKAS